MAKHLIPRNSYDGSSGLWDTPLQMGEIFLDSGRPGSNPGRIILGDGTSTYNDFNSSTYTPFITDPSIYIPKFFNSTYASTAANSFEVSMNYAEQYIDYMGDGSGSTASQININQLFGNIKAVLCKHDDALNAFHKETYFNNQDIIPDRSVYSIGSTAVPFREAHIDDLYFQTINYSDNGTSFYFSRGNYIDAWRIFNNSTTYRFQLDDLSKITFNKISSNYLNNRQLTIEPDDILAEPVWIDATSVSYYSLKDTLKALYDTSLKYDYIYINDNTTVATNTSTYINVYKTNATTYPYGFWNICNLYFREENSFNANVIIKPIDVNTSGNSATITFKVNNLDQNYNFSGLNGGLYIMYQ